MIACLSDSVISVVELDRYCHRDRNRIDAEFVWFLDALIRIKCAIADFRITISNKQKITKFYENTKLINYTNTISFIILIPI